jgi:acetyltransferase
VTDGAGTPHWPVVTRRVDIVGPTRVRELSDPFVDELADLWMRVNRAGGAVGFGIDADPADVAAAAARNVADARAGRVHLIELRRGGDLVGVVKLEPGDGPIVAHRGMVKLLMVDPDLRGHDWGVRLHDACVALARDIGLEQLYLSARGGTGLPGYYARLGWREVGRYPGGLRVAPGDDRDEVWFFRDLTA